MTLKYGAVRFVIVPCLGLSSTQTKYCYGLTGFQICHLRKSLPRNSSVGCPRICLTLKVLIRNHLVWYLGGFHQWIKFDRRHLICSSSLRSICSSCFD